MDFNITDKAKEKLTAMKEHNIPIMLTAYRVGWAGKSYEIASAEQTDEDNVYNVDGIEIIVPKEFEKELKGVKINYGGLILKDFIITPFYK